MFDLQRFIDDCRTAASAGDPGAARDLVARAVSEPEALIQALGAPTRGGVHKLYNTEQLTIINVAWAPHMTLKPHNHEMWAVIGIYTGREDNIFWRRLPEASPNSDEPGYQIEAAGAKSLGAKSVIPLGKDIIHSVTNPLSRITGAIHVYGGDFFGKSRSEWDAERLREQPYDVAANMSLFEAANSRFTSD